MPKPTGYAATTDVPVEQTQADIEATLRRYGATAFGRGWDGLRAVVLFELAGRKIRIGITLPDPDAKEMLKATDGRRLTPREREGRYQQALRTRWRAFLLVIKAKCESVESGILTLEEAWLPHVVMANGKTVGEWATPQIEAMYETGQMPALLPGLKALPGEADA